MGSFSDGGRTAEEKADLISFFQVPVVDNICTSHKISMQIHTCVRFQALAAATPPGPLSTYRRTHVKEEM